MSVAEGKACIGESWREATKTPIVYWRQQAVHVGVGALQARGLAHSMVTQYMDGLLQAVLHFTLLYKHKRHAHTSQ